MFQSTVPWVVTIVTGHASCARLAHIRTARPRPAVPAVGLDWQQRAVAPSPATTATVSISSPSNDILLDKKTTLNLQTQCYCPETRLLMTTTLQTFLAMWSWPPSSESRHSDGQGGLLTIPSSSPAGLWWTWGGSAQRRPASTIQPVVLGWKLTLFCWTRQSGGIRSAVGGQKQWNGKSVGTEKSQEIEE